MKLEINENSLYASAWLSGIALIASLFISALAYNHYKNKLILRADTCEKAAFIEGAYSDRVIAVCKIKTQQ